MASLRTMKILTNDTDTAIKQTTNININPTNTPPPGTTTATATNDVFPSVYPNPYDIQPTDIPMGTDDKDTQIKVLETIIECYSNNPLIIDKLVLVKSKKLVELIKTMCNADKVELTYDEDLSGCCCMNKTLFMIQKIFVTKNNKVVDFKYGYINEYSLLKKYNISLKLTF